MYVLRNGLGLLPHLKSNCTQPQVHWLHTTVKIHKKDNLKRENPFDFTVPGVLAHGDLDPLCWACINAECHGGDKSQKNLSLYSSPKAKTARDRSKMQSPRQHSLHHCYFPRFHNELEDYPVTNLAMAQSNRDVKVFMTLNSSPKPLLWWTLLHWGPSLQ